MVTYYSYNHSGKLVDGDEYYIDKYYPGCKATTPEGAKAEFLRTYRSYKSYHESELKRITEILKEHDES